jgi:hypothetical protein
MTIIPRETLAWWRTLLRPEIARRPGPFRDDDLDEDYWAALRAWLLETGASEREIDQFAAFVICLVVMVTSPYSVERHAQIDLIATYLACTDLDVHLDACDRCVQVDFPSRDTVH